MTRKVHTIIFVPHARARFRQLRVSSRTLAVASCGLALVVLLGATFSVLWLRSLGRSREFTTLLAENQDLRSRAKLQNAKLESIERQLAEFEEKTRKLSIVAGLSGIHDPGTGGVGGLSLPMKPETSTDVGLGDAARRGGTLSSRLGLVESRLVLQADKIALTPTVAPAFGILTAGFGRRSDPFTGAAEMHTGIDISTPTGNRVHAPAAGTVVKVGWDRGYGRVIEISHGYGVGTLYGHLEATRVAEGQRVKRGDVIGLVGSSGRSTGPHLHYEVHLDGKQVNPLDYVLNAF